MEKLLANPNIVNDTKKFKEISKKYSEMTLLADKIKQIFSVRESIDENIDLMKTEKDSEIKSLLNEEIKQLKILDETILSEIKVLLIPKEPNDDKNIILEIIYFLLCLALSSSFIFYLKYLLSNLVLFISKCINRI